MFKVVHYGETNVGRERKNNEDAYRIAADAGVYLVCDGMGGHASGEIASQIAADVIVRFLAMDRFRPDFRWPPESSFQQSEEGRALDAAVRAANREVFAQAQANPLHKGMGTTIVGVYAGRQRLGLVHVGDSRIYRFRDGELEQLTDDHSLLNYYMNTRPMSAQQIKTFAGKNVIVRAVGLRDSVEPDVQLQDYRADDVYLMCSDGLNDMLEDEQIGEVLATAKDGLAEAGGKLIELALANGGKDNVTVLLLQVTEAPDQTKSINFARRTLPMAALAGFDTTPGASLDDLQQAGADEELSLVDLQTKPEIHINLPRKFGATQPVRAMSRDDLTPPAGTPLGPHTGEIATGIKELASPDEKTVPVRRPMARMSQQLVNPNDATDPHGLPPVVVVRTAEDIEVGIGEADPDFVDDSLTPLPGEDDLDGPTLPIHVRVIVTGRAASAPTSPDLTVVSAEADDEESPEPAA